MLRQYVIIQFLHSYHLQHYQQAVQGLYYSWYKGQEYHTASNNITYTPPALTHLQQYYCAVTSGTCGTVTTNNITITVYGNLTFRGNRKCTNYML